MNTSRKRRRSDADIRSAAAAAAARRRRTALVESSRVESVAGLWWVAVQRCSIIHRFITDETRSECWIRYPLSDARLSISGIVLPAIRQLSNRGIEPGQAHPHLSLFLPFVNNLSTLHSCSVASTHCAIFHAIYCLFIMSFLYDNNNNAGLSSQVEFVPIAVESHGPINNDALQFWSELVSWRLVETTGDVRAPQISVATVQLFNSILLHDAYVDDNRLEYGALPNKSLSTFVIIIIIIIMVPATMGR